MQYEDGNSQNQAKVTTRPPQDTIDTGRRQESNILSILRRQWRCFAAALTGSNLDALVRTAGTLLLLSLAVSSLIPFLHVLMAPFSPSEIAHSIYTSNYLALTRLLGIGNTGNRAVYQATEHPLMDDIAGLLHKYALLPAKAQLLRIQEDQQEDAGHVNFDLINMPVLRLMGEIEWLVWEACQIDTLEGVDTNPGSRAKDKSPCRHESVTEDSMMSNWTSVGVQLNFSMRISSIDLVYRARKDINKALRRIKNRRWSAAADVEHHAQVTRVVLDTLARYLRPDAEIRHELAITTPQLATAVEAIAWRRSQIDAIVRHVQNHPMPTIPQWKEHTMASNQQILDGTANAVLGLQYFEPALAEIEHALRTTVATMNEILIPGFAALEQEVEALRSSSLIPRVRFAHPNESGPVDVVDKALVVDNVWVKQGPADLEARGVLRVFFLPPVEQVLAMLERMDVEQRQVYHAVRTENRKQQEVYDKWSLARAGNQVPMQSFRGEGAFPFKKRDRNRIPTMQEKEIAAVIEEQIGLHRLRGILF